jgi:Peptidase C13 family
MRFRVATSLRQNHETGCQTVKINQKFRRVAALALTLLAGPAALSQGAAEADKGFFMEQGRTPAWYYDQHQRVGKAIASLSPERKGTVDAFVVVAGLDADTVFGKEAAEVARVLSRRYDAAGRTIMISAGTGAGPQTGPYATSSNLSTLLAGVASKMNLKEDVLILYTTSHGSPGIGVVFQDKPNGVGFVSPTRMAEMLNGLGFSRRLLMVSACYSGQFVAPLQNDDTIVLTAASAERSSFGCAPGNDWTFFGDALVNAAFRKPQPLSTAVKEAHGLIAGWEADKKLKPSEPQMSFGKKSDAWLSALEKRMPKTATAKVGKPAIDFDKP